MDNFDAVEDLVIYAGTDVNVLTGICLRGVADRTNRREIHGRVPARTLARGGLPRYAKFDNGTVFHGTHRWPDSLGRFTRMCLSLKVTPVFAPPPLCREFSSRHRSLRPSLARGGLVALHVPQSRRGGGSIEPLCGRTSRYSWSTSCVCPHGLGVLEKKEKEDAIFSTKASGRSQLSNSTSERLRQAISNIKLQNTGTQGVSF